MAFARSPLPRELALLEDSSSLPFDIIHRLKKLTGCAPCAGDFRRKMPQQRLYGPYGVDTISSVVACLLFRWLRNKIRLRIHGFAV